MQVLQTQTKTELSETSVFEAFPLFTGSVWGCFSVILGQEKIGRQKNAPSYLVGVRYKDAEVGLWISPFQAWQVHSPYFYSKNGSNPINEFDLDGNNHDHSFIRNLQYQANSQANQLLNPILQIISRIFGINTGVNCNNLIDRAALESGIICQKYLGQ